MRSFTFVGALIGAAMAKWSPGTIASDAPLMVLYYDEWAAWQRGVDVGMMEKLVLSRSAEVRNWVINFAFLGWNAEECRLVPTDHEVEYSKGDTNMFNSAMIWWDPTSSGANNLSGSISALMALRQKYPYLKIMPSVGGWSRSHTFHDCLMNGKADTMVASAADVVYMYGWDGLDLDWEYPSCDHSDCGCQGEATCPNTSNKAGPGDWGRYKDFIVKLRARFDDLEDKMQKKLYVTAALGVNPKLLDGNNDVWTESTPIEWICNENNGFDWVNLMTYDFYGPWSPATGPLAPLYNTEGTGFDQMSIDDSLTRILKRCQHPEKLTMGLATYGKTWVDVPRSGNTPGLWQTSTNSNPMAEGTWEKGTVSYWETKSKFLSNSACTRTFDDISKTPTLFCTSNPKATYESNVFISYEDGESWKYKMEYAKQHGMAGGIIWANSDFGNDPTLEVASDLLDGALLGWNGAPKPIGPVYANGKFNFTPLTKNDVWPTFPCPIPYGKNLDSFTQIPNNCYDSTPDYMTQQPPRGITGTGAQDLIGKDVMLINNSNVAPLPPSPATTTTTNTPATTTTTTTTPPPNPSPNTPALCPCTPPPATTTTTTPPYPATTTTTPAAPATTTTSPATTPLAPTTTTTTTPAQANGGDMVSECQARIVGSAGFEHYSDVCKDKCAEYAPGGDLTPWCPNPQTASDLISCVSSQNSYCVDS